MASTNKDLAIELLQRVMQCEKDLDACAAAFGSNQPGSDRIAISHIAICVNRLITVVGTLVADFGEQGGMSIAEVKEILDEDRNPRDESEKEDD